MRVLTGLQLAQSQSVTGVTTIQPAAACEYPISVDRQVASVSELCGRLMGAVASCVDVPVVLHGDDSSVIGVGYGLLQQADRLGMLYFDAHGDANTFETSPSGCIYGMGVAHLLGHGCPQILALNGSRHYLNPKDVFLVGTRSLDPGEEGFIREEGLNVFSAPEVGADLPWVIRSIEGLVVQRGIRRLYVHIDQDVIDPIESGATLCREEDGISVEQLLLLIGCEWCRSRMGAVSIGNYFPGLDEDGRTLTVIERTLRSLGVIA
jgi:arginase